VFESAPDLLEAPDFLLGFLVSLFERKQMDRKNIQQRSDVLSNTKRTAPNTTTDRKGANYVNNRNPETIPKVS
jgi:hypothetical protein